MVPDAQKVKQAAADSEAATGSAAAPVDAMVNNVPPTTPSPKESYHDSLTVSTKVSVVYIPEKGKAMITKEKIAKDDIILTVYPFPPLTPSFSFIYFFFETTALQR